MKMIILLFFLVLAGPAILICSAQPYDIVIRGGTIIDPANQINSKMDLAIAGNQIRKVAINIPGDSARQVIDATGLYVVPGLIDIHVHVFFGTEPDAYISNSFTSVQPDAFSFRSGVTTMVDAGSSGWRNFEVFKNQTIANSKTRVLAFLNIVGYGMKGGVIEQNIKDMNATLAARMASKYPDLIVGFKLAHYSGPEWNPVDSVVQAGVLTDKPVMIDFGGNNPPLSLETLLMEKLRPGDIFTHAYAGVRGRMPVVDENGKLRDDVLKAQQRGIIFDVGHGGGSFLFVQAVPAVHQGLKPNTISTDLHTGSMNGGMKDMLNVMSKFLNMNLSLEEVISRSTYEPAKVIQRPDLGTLGVHSVADVAILKLETSRVGFTDTQGWRMDGNKKLTCELTILDGNVVWDLNGLSRPAWQEPRGSN